MVSYSITRKEGSSKMAVWWQALILPCCILVCVVSSAPVSPRNKYNISFRLARSTRTQVQQLNKKYKEQQLGNINFEDRSQQLKGLPLLSVDFSSWLKLTDRERLNAAFSDMQTYWNLLEWKRKQLEVEDREQTAGQGFHITLPQSIELIQLDLRDLMSQVSNQLNNIESSWTKPTSPTAQAAPHSETSSKTEWDSRVEGYIILRDLDLYLIKLARDFLLLASRTGATQQ